MIQYLTSSVNAKVEHVNFEKLDFGETQTLDHFYNADVAVVDMSIQMQQSALFYHLGVRESMGMTGNFIMVHDVDADVTHSLRVSTRFIYR